MNRSGKNHPNFAHPSEEEFARILDYYGVEWEYEPRTFVLEQDTRGNILEAFSPDFYLPQQDLYIELTTLRPKLIRIKNRKITRSSSFPRCQHQALQAPKLLRENVMIKLMALTSKAE